MSLFDPAIFDPAIFDTGTVSVPVGRHPYFVPTPDPVAAKPDPRIAERKRAAERQAAQMRAAITAALVELAVRERRREEDWLLGLTDNETYMRRAA